MIANKGKSLVDEVTQGREVAMKTQNSETSSNSAASQRQRLLQHLTLFESATTLKARNSLDVMHPAARIMELRQAGYCIETVWVSDITPEGYVHRVAKYLLRPQKQRSILELITPDTPPRKRGQMTEPDMMTGQLRLKKSKGNK